MHNIIINGKEYKDGYEYIDYMFNKISEDSNHELSLEDALEFIKFYGLKNCINAQGKFGFVGKAAIDRLDYALAWEKYDLIKKE